MAIRKAKREEVKLKIGLGAPSGGGKTYSSLLLAKGLMGSLDDVAVLDTENGSADLYSHLGNYGVQTMQAPFEPQRFIKAIDYFVKEGVKCMVIDSASHEWEGPGGCLEIHQKLGGQFHHWNIVTPMHQAYIDAILQAPIHIIVTNRKKQDYVLETNIQGKVAPKKVGMKDIQRDGWEYNLSCFFDIDIHHYATVTKDRTGLFDSKIPFMITESTGIKLREWNNGANANNTQG